MDGVGCENNYPPRALVVGRGGWAVNLIMAALGWEIRLRWAAVVQIITVAHLTSTAFHIIIAKIVVSK